MTIERLPIADRIRRNMIVDDESGCWLWTGHCGSNGYARMQVPREGGGWKTGLAHRAAYTALVGPIPAGMQLDHSCNVPRCVNPGHLAPVTGRENNARSQSPSARNGRKTVCANGHPFDAANTYVFAHGRRCRACGREATKRYEQRRAAKRAAEWSAA